MNEKKIYIFDITENKFLFSDKCRYNASQKPRLDTIKTLIKLGAGRLLLYSLPFEGINSWWKLKIIKIFNRIILYIQFLFHCHSINNSIIFIQFPFINSKSAFFVNKLRKRNNKIILFVHDLESLRRNIFIQDEIDTLNAANVCILHTSNMINAVREFHVKTTALALEFFDYCSDIEINSVGNVRNITLVYAGNLDKSVFLKDLFKLELNDSFQINLYGKESKNVPIIKFVHYKGKFDADDFSKIEGNWGLVWDGESIDSCTGYYGEYLKFNSPFKASLYLAANIPIVTWSKSAIAEYVRKYHLGICVDSLADIPETIEKLSDEDLHSIIIAVKRISKNIRTGQQLGKKLNAAVSLFNVTSDDL